MKDYKKLIIVSIALMCLLWLAPKVSAVDGQENTTTEPPRTDNTTSTTTEQPMRQGDGTGPYRPEIQKQITEKKDGLIQQIKNQNKDRKEQKLDDAKKKICQEKTEDIKSNMGKISQTGQKNGDFLNSVVEKIKNFVSKNNLTVENYDTLLADIASAKASLEASKQVLDTYKTQFDCSSDPKSTASDFKTALQSMKDAEKTYKQSVKSLLEATKTAAKAAGIQPQTDKPKTENMNNNESNTAGGNQQ